MNELMLLLQQWGLPAAAAAIVAMLVVRQFPGIVNWIPQVAKIFKPAQPVELSVFPEAVELDRRKTLACYAIDIADAIGVDKLPVGLFGEICQCDKKFGEQITPGYDPTASVASETS